MSCIHSLKHIQGFPASYLSYDNTAGSRKVLSIVEIGGYENGKVGQEVLFSYDKKEKRLKKCGELKARDKLADVCG